MILGVEFLPESGFGMSPSSSLHIHSLVKDLKAEELCLDAPAHRKWGGSNRHGVRLPVSKTYSHEAGALSHSSLDQTRGHRKKAEGSRVAHGFQR